MLLEFLLGNGVLVAPILDEGATMRDIYLPIGTWRDEVLNDDTKYEGPIWLRDYPADLYTLPYFAAI
jgi:alpha-glucosidase (family GH31 glycosyl hydrolase)